MIKMDYSELINKLEEYACYEVESSLSFIFCHPKWFSLNANITFKKRKRNKEQA